jgi:hypothetical protein
MKTALSRAGHRNLPDPATKLRLSYIFFENVIEKCSAAKLQLSILILIITK